MKILSGLTHLIFGFILMIMAIATLKDNWKTPALMFLCGGASSIAIGVGIFARARWVRWLILLLFSVVTLMAGYLLVGSIIWPEYVSTVILIMYIAYFLFEMFTWRIVRHIHNDNKITLNT